MKVKVQAPFGKGNHKITQTYHQRPVQNAVDISAITGREVLGHRGKVAIVRDNLGQKSYVAIDIGEDELLFYVHIVPKVKEGQEIKMGQVIGTVHKKVQFPTHLHMTFQRRDRKPSNYKLMDYISRDANWYATGEAIKKLWCKSDGTLDWRKFGNKYVEIPDNCEKYVQEIADLKLELIEVEKKLAKCESDKKLLEERNEKLEGDVDDLEEACKTQKEVIEDYTSRLAKCSVSLVKARRELSECRTELEKLSTVNGLLSALLKKLIGWLEFVKKSE